MTSASGLDPPILALVFHNPKAIIEECRTDNYMREPPLMQETWTAQSQQARESREHEDALVLLYVLQPT
jgi:hypothetical protein